MINNIQSVDLKMAKTFADGSYTAWRPSSFETFQAITLQTRVAAHRRQSAGDSKQTTHPDFDPNRLLQRKVQDEGLSIDPTDHISLAALDGEGAHRHAKPAEFRKGDIVQVDFAMCIIPSRGKRSHQLKLVLRRMLLLRSRFTYV